MTLENLKIARAIVHQFGGVTDSLTSIDSFLSDSPQPLTDEVQRDLANKIVDHLASSSMSHEMIIIESGANSAFSYLTSLINGDDEAFTQSSKALARTLKQSHQGSAIANSVLMVLNGTYGVDNAPIVIVIKADKHQALAYSPGEQLRLIQDLFLGGSRRLNKIAAFAISGSAQPISPKNCSVSVFDGQTKGGAEYFRARFLGLGLAPTGARFTELLSKETNAYLEKSDLPLDRKAKIAKGLNSEIWNSIETSLDVASFASKFIPKSHQDKYMMYMYEAGLPEQSFSRDTTRLSQGKTYGLKFSNGMQLLLPWGQIDDNLSIIETPEEDGTWTTIRFKGHKI